MDRVISYAQNREDIILSGFLNGIKNGFYIDVGANYPTEDSVTKYFYDKGWSGINIEPNSKLHSMLMDERTKDINLCLGISNKKGKLTLREYDSHGLSTFSDSLKKVYKDTKYTHAKKFHDREVKVVTLKDVFTKYAKNKTVHFMKIDVEGHEYEVLEGNDWNKYRPQVLCIEAGYMPKDWRPILVENSYNKIFFDGLNEYWVASECKNTRTFSYPDTMLPANKVVNFYINNQIIELESLLKSSGTKLRVPIRVKVKEKFPKTYDTARKIYKSAKP